MEEVLYEPVNKTEVYVSESGGRSRKKNREQRDWKPLLRQILVCSGVWTSFFISGLNLGAPTVLIPQIRKETNSTDAISYEMASWMCKYHENSKSPSLNSIQGYASICWFFLPILSEWFGRKYPFFIVSVVSLISHILFYLSVTNTHILISEVLQSLLFACHYISIAILTEYTSPNYRGLFLALKSASMYWGMWVANALGTFCHWRSIAIAGIICSVYNLMTTPFWCESPSWFAFKQRYTECIKAHRWIKGEDPESEKELVALVKSCKEYRETQYIEEEKNHMFFKRLYKTITNKVFFKPLLLSIAILSLYHASGKIVCSVYVIDIIKKITSSESTAYMGMLLLDAVTVSGMYIGSALSKSIRRRTLLFTGSVGGIFFLFIMAFYLFLVKLKLLEENKYVSLTILTLFFLFISCGPIILSTSIYGELMPLRYRTAGMLLAGFYMQFLLGTSLKIAPFIFRVLEIHGAFVFYGIISTAFIILLYKYLPETKDKTLQEIEQCFIGKRHKYELRRDTQSIFQNL